MDNLVAEILKDAPKGLQLYSPAFGWLEFIEVMDDYAEGPVIAVESRENGTIYNFMPNGKYTEYGECMLFPHEKHMTWDAWQEWLFTSGDFVTSADGFRETLFLGGLTDTAMDAKGNTARITMEAYRWATKEEKDAFLAELKRNGHGCDENTKGMKPAASNDSETMRRFTFEDIYKRMLELYKDSLTLQLVKEHFAIIEPEKLEEAQEEIQKAENHHEAERIYNEIDSKLNEKSDKWSVKDGWELTLDKDTLDWPSSADKPEGPEPQFKVGDWVTVRERQGDGSRYRHFYIDDMTAFAGKAYRIREAKKDRNMPMEHWLPDDGYVYTLEGDTLGWSWPSSALEPCDRHDSDNWSC